MLSKGPAYLEPPSSANQSQDGTPYICVTGFGTPADRYHRLVITSDSFKAKAQPARHRMVYALLKDEMAREGGIHALQLRTMTPEEAERRRQQQEAAEAASEGG